MKTGYIECDGHLVYTMFGDRYELASGRHEILSLPKFCGDPGESDEVKANRLAQKLKQAFPQKITLSVEYDEASAPPEPVVEAPVEAAPPVPEAKPAAKPAPKKAAETKKGKRGK
jgi:hypothetical protein